MTELPSRTAADPHATALDVRPRFIDLPHEQLRAWSRGEGPTVLVLPGLIDSPQSVCRRVSLALPGHRIVALELPGLGASPASAGTTIDEIAAQVDEVAASLGAMAGCIAFDLALPVALRCVAGLARSGSRGSRLVLVDAPKATWLARAKPDAGDFELDEDGTYLYELWAHLRDMDMLESIEPRRPRDHGTYKSAEALDETFMAFAVQPKAYSDLWRRASQAVRELGTEALATVAQVADIDSLDAGLFSGPPLVVTRESPPAPSTLVIRRGYEDIAAGRIHYRTAGHGKTCVVALANGAFSSAILSPLLLNLNEHHTVVVPDYIGQGDSCRAPAETTIAQAAVEIDELVRKLGWSEYFVYGTQTGAGVALEMAIAFPERVKRLVIDSCSMQHASERTEHRARYFPSMVPDLWGSHVFQTWNILKDGEVFWPWYKPVPASAKESTSTGLERLHDSVICTLRSRTTPVYKSMSSYEARNRVALVHQPVLFVTGPKDIFKNAMAEAERLSPPNFAFRDVPATVWGSSSTPGSVEATCVIYDRFFLDSN